MKKLTKNLKTLGGELLAELNSQLRRSRALILFPFRTSLVVVVQDESCGFGGSGTHPATAKSHGMAWLTT